MSEFFLKVLPKNSKEIREFCESNQIKSCNLIRWDDLTVKTGEEYIFVYKSGEPYLYDQLCGQIIVTEDYNCKSFNNFFGDNFYVYRVIKNNKRIRKII
jgi:hypothetical protein